jgi:transcriptional regulator with XRE-family HTH domain
LGGETARLGLEPELYLTPLLKIEPGGIRSPTIDTVQKIAKALDVSVDILLK